MLLSVEIGCLCMYVFAEHMLASLHSSLQCTLNTRIDLRRDATMYGQHSIREALSISECKMAVSMLYAGNVNSLPLLQKARGLQFSKQHTNSGTSINSGSPINSGSRPSIAAALQEHAFQAVIHASEMSICRSSVVNTVLVPARHSTHILC